MLSNKLTTEEALKAIDDKIEEEVLDAVKFADESPFPEEHEMYEDMFDEENPYFHV